jgi:DNA-binding GntR family transcriptional regulator
LTKNNPKREGGSDKALIYELLRAEILSCALPPGAKIFEQRLARRFGVSKSPVREALLRLREQNLVEVRPRSGYRVKPISISEIREMYEIRLVYEVACVDLAIRHFDKKKLARLRQSTSFGGRHSVAEWIIANRHFHMALAETCGNSRLMEMASEFISQFDRFTLVSANRLSKPPNFRSFAAEHLAIVEAIERRNKRSATTLIRRHIEASQKRTLASLNNPLIVS